MQTSTAPRDLGDRARRMLAVVFAGALAVAGTVLLVMAPALISGTRGDDVPYYRSPAFFPMIALAIVAVAAALHVVRLRRGADMSTDDIDEPDANWPTVLAAFAAYAGYIVAVPFVGYVASTGCFLLALGFVARLGWRVPLVLAIAVTGALFVVFVIGLNVWFPTPALQLHP